MTNNNVYILAINRTAIGKFLGTLSDLSAVDLGSQLLGKMLDNYPIVKEKVDEVIVGNVLSAGARQNVARQVSIHSGISNEVPAYTVNMVCGSGLKSIYEAYTHIKAGEADCIIAGGVESMSNAKFVTANNIRKGNKMGSLELEDSMLTDGLTDAFDGLHMGITAENIAKKYNISRRAQDEFAMKSQEKARKAQASAIFKDEIIPVTVRTRKEEYLVDEDEYINFTTNLEMLTALRPAFDKEGTVTAGNASGINDGAAFAFVVSEKFVKEHNLKPLVELVAFGQAGVDPKYMGVGPVKAIQTALNKSNLALDAIEAIELNEAFASQSITVLDQLSENNNLDKELLEAKVNPYGGAISLGHPIGASGTRISATLIHHMLRTQAQYGLASLCIGGGMGISMIVKRV